MDKKYPYGWIQIILKSQDLDHQQILFYFLLLFYTIFFLIIIIIINIYSLILLFSFHPPPLTIVCCMSVVISLSYITFMYYLIINPLWSFACLGRLHPSPSSQPSGLPHVASSASPACPAFPARARLMYGWFQGGPQLGPPDAERRSLSDSKSNEHRNDGLFTYKYCV